MREKKRYLLVSFDAELPFDEKAARQAVYNAIFELLG